MPAARGAVGSEIATAIVSPLVAGYVIDVIGNGYLLMSMGLLLLGLSSPFLMHPETPFEQDGVASPAAGALPAGYKNR